MVPDAETQSGPIWARQGDSRTTWLGRIMRRYSFDELPQLVNVLLGEMSLVGPRPERPYFVEQFKQIIPRYEERHREKAGMTGWAQVNGLRGNTSIEERTKYDIYYVENWSPLLDIKILLRTVFTSSRGATHTERLFPLRVHFRLRESWPETPGANARRGREAR